MITRRSLRNLVWYWLPVFGWMGLIFFISSRSNLPGLPEPWFDVVFKKATHLGAYAILAFWWWRALTRGRHASWPALLGSLVATLAYAVTDEYHQTFVPGRHGWAVDVMIDSAGALLMLLVLRWRLRSVVAPHKALGRLSKADGT